ncbi:M55 family metallopeptidase [Streptomyces sp.]|uniref:M55 family metallopeptidase n=1 Tax=Streptomyces sp. TaxID=1931 RepID=UPI002D5A83C7|nr:M55 family metallopeptidase [Streptomyces sp.]HZF88175.1 M55 family metallopeptidase [Streptomyces sp.]
MKILISADMEGATGVTWPADVLPGTPQWERCRAMFTSDVQAAALGFFDGGADRVLVNEAHWTMRNLLLERLDDRVEMLTGRHKSLSMVEGVQHGDVDGIAFVGYHAGAGMEGVLAHTYLANSITGVWLNDVRASEGLLNAHVVAEYGVPVVLVTGDDVACEDALGYAPEALKVAVKDHVSRYAAVCRTPARTAADIRAAAKEAVALAGRRDPMAARPHTAGGPVAAGGPYTVAVEFDAEHLAMAATVVPGVGRVGERKVAYTSPTMYEGIRTFKAVTTVASAAVEEQYG